MDSNIQYPKTGEADFLNRMFEEFNISSIRYAVMRNYQSLPYTCNGSDLDILIHPEDEVVAIKIIYLALQANAGVVMGTAKSVLFLKIFAFGYCGTDPSNWWGIRLDISFGVNYWGACPILDDSVLRDRCIRHGQIKALPDDAAAVLGVLKEVLHNNVLPVRYLEQASVAIADNWEQVSLDFAPMGNEALLILRAMCSSNFPLSDLRKSADQLRRVLRGGAFRTAPFDYVRLRVAFEWSKVLRYLEPPGTMVAVLGTDGAGKSTLIASIEPVLSQATHGDFTVKHLRPGLLPPLSRLRGEPVEASGPVVDPHASSVSGIVGSTFRLMYLLMDYILGYWVVVRPKLSKSPTLVLFDRYAYDIEIDPRRFRIGLPTNVLAWFTRFAPKPEVVFCLHGDPEVIANRKRELPIKEVIRQVSALREFSDRQPTAFLVSTEGEVKESCDRVLFALHDYFDRKNHRC